MVDLRLPALPGDFPAPRRTRYRLTLELPYDPQPDWFLGSLGEWVVFYYLTRVHRPRFRQITAADPPDGGTYRFFYQIQAHAAGLFALTPTTRIDFYLPNFGGFGYDALVLDPYNEVVHGGFGGDGEDGLSLDYAKRHLLAIQENIRLIWLHSARLDAGDFSVIEAALAGRDESPRSVLGI